jgi:hypothetical protein
MATIIPDLVQYIMPHLTQLFCNSSTVTSTAVSLTATKLKPLIFQFSKFHKHLFFYSWQAIIIHFTEGTQ